MEFHQKLGPHAKMGDLVDLGMEDMQKYPLARCHRKRNEKCEIALQIIPGSESSPNGYQYVNCYMVFNIKMEDFWRKTCLVVGGHMIHTLDVITYFSVVTRETVCIVLTMVALYDIEVKTADILEAYVSAPNKERIWTVLGTEFGDDLVNLL